MRKKNVLAKNNNTDSKNNIKTDILNIFSTCKENEKNSLKSLEDFNFENSNNLFDFIGFSHNKVLEFIVSDNLDKSTLCSKIPDVNKEFGVNVSSNCNKLFDICLVGISNTFDNESNFKSDLFLNLLNENKIEEEEYEIVSTTFLNSNDLDFTSKMDFIKDYNSSRTKAPNYDEVFIFLFNHYKLKYFCPKKSFKIKPYTLEEYIFNRRSTFC